MPEQASALIERPEHAATAEDLAARFSATADDLITRAFAVRGHFNHNVGDNGVGIHVYSTNDTGSSGKGGDVLKTGDLYDIPSEASVAFRLVREREQIPEQEADSRPLGSVPEAEEKKGMIGPLTGAYEFAEFRHDPGISSDHVDADYNWIDSRGGKPALRPARDGSLEATATAAAAKLEAIREVVEAAEARASQSAAKQAKVLPTLKNWFRRKLPFQAEQ